MSRCLNIKIPKRTEARIGETVQTKRSEHIRQSTPVSHPAEHVHDKKSRNTGTLLHRDGMLVHFENHQMLSGNRLGEKRSSSQNGVDFANTP